jgi:hypothetical protein
MKNSKPIIVTGGIVFLFIVSGCDRFSESPAHENPARVAHVSARESMRGSMRSPSQTTFIDSESFYEERTDGTYYVGGVVDAPNAFGVMLRQNWSMVVKPTKGNKYSILWKQLGDDSSGDFPLAEYSADSVYTEDELEEKRVKEKKEQDELEEKRVKEKKEQDALTALKSRKELMELYQKTLLEEAQEKQIALEKEESVNKQITYAAIAKSEHTFEVFTTTTGKEYIGATVKEVTDKGIYITHRDGGRTIPFENIPNSIKSALGLKVEPSKP